MIAVPGCGGLKPTLRRSRKPGVTNVNVELIRYHFAPPLGWHLQLRSILI